MPREPVMPRAGTVGSRSGSTRTRPETRWGWRWAGRTAIGTAHAAPNDFSSLDARRLEGRGESVGVVFQGVAEVRRAVADAEAEHVDQERASGDGGVDGDGREVRTQGGAEPVQVDPGSLESSRYLHPTELCPTGCHLCTAHIPSSIHSTYRQRYTSLAIYSEAAAVSRSAISSAVSTSAKPLRRTASSGSCRDSSSVAVTSDPKTTL